MNEIIIKKPEDHINSHIVVINKELYRKIITIETRDRILCDFFDQCYLFSSKIPKYIEWRINE